MGRLSTLMLNKVLSGHFTDTYMLIFNCSKAAALHLSPDYNKKGNGGIFEPSDDAYGTVAGRSKKHGGNMMQWVVHAVKIGRSTCLIAMEYETRWVHVIHRVKKGDVEDFVNRLNTRLVNAIDWISADYSLFSEKELEAGCDKYFDKHNNIGFIQQTDASVLAHITQVKQQYNHAYEDIGGLPDNESEATSFDLHLNEWWRQIKSDGYNANNTVKCRMLAYWMKNIMNKKDNKIAQAVSRISSTQIGGVINAFEDYLSKEITDNVIDITSRLNNKLY